MSTEITKPQNFEEVVRDRVRKVIFDSIPDEQIDALIKGRYEQMFKRRVEYSREIPSEFDVMVDRLIKKKLEEKVTELIDSSFDASWSTNQRSVLEEITKKFAPTAIESLAAALVQGALNNFRNSMQNANY